MGHSTMRLPSFLRVALFGAMGAGVGVVYGVFFGAMAALFEGGPTVVNGVFESWWWFGAFGGVGGLAIAFEPDTLPALSFRPKQ